MTHLKRKDFLKKGGIALAGSALAATAACSSETSESQGPNIQRRKKYRWKMVTTWAPNFPVVGEGCNLFAEWVKEMSGGAMEIQVFGGGELVPALETFEAVSNGVAELGHGAAYYWAGTVPAGQFFSTVPFGMNGQQMNAWLTNGGGLELWEELYQPFDLLPIPAGNTGVQMGGWFNKEINSIQDLKGLKMRIPGLGGKVLDKAGGSPVLVAGGEIYTNLERGVIDATEWIGPYHDYLKGLYQIAKYYYYPGWHEPGTTLELLVNRSRYEALPKELQEIIRTAAYRQNVWVLSEFEAKNAVYLQKLLKEENVDMRPFPDDVLQQLKNYTREVLEEMTADDPVSKKIYDAYRAFQDGANNWAKVSEQVYYNSLGSASSLI